MTNSAKKPKFDYAGAWTALRDEVKARYPISAALEEEFPGLKLQGRGTHLKACCPFHVDKNPSFSVNTDRGIYRCFSSGCGQSGDVFQLLQDRYNTSFREALLMAADRAGVSVPQELRDGKRANFVKRAPTKARPRPSPDEIRFIPEDLTAPNLSIVPSKVSRPLPGRPFQMWQNGGRGGQDFDMKKYWPEMVHEYRDVDGDHLLSILRIKFPDRKFFIPARLAAPKGGCPSMLTQKVDGADMAWVNDAGLEGARRPIYGMEKLRAWIARGGSRLLIVEGEKTADRMTEFLAAHDPETLVLSPMGGGEATIFMDWAPFFAEIAAHDHRFETVIWQDADAILQRHDGSKVDRQRKYINQLSTSFMQAAIDAGLPGDQFPLSHLLPPEGVKSGWDGADALEEGWDAKTILEFLSSTKEVQMSQLKIRHDPELEAETTAAGGPEAPVPFDQDEDPDLMAAYIRESATDDDAWIVDAKNDAQEEGDLEDTLEAFLSGNVTETAETAEAPSQATPTEPVAAPVSQGVPVEEAGDLIDEDDDDAPPRPSITVDNPFFRCMGYRDNQNFFLSIQSGQVFGYKGNQLNREGLLTLAPLEFWRLHYVKEATGNYRQNGDGIDWVRATDEMIQTSYSRGPWDPAHQVVQGARMDGKTVVFHTGLRLFVDGRNGEDHVEGTCRIGEFNGKYCYTIGPNQSRTPAFSHPFEANSNEVARLLQLLRALDWRRGTSHLSILATFGWITISPICGILDWRPHLWLDGPRSSGKSWIVNHVISPALGDYHEKVVGNTSESGLRNALNHRYIPVIFDEAEGENNSNRIRMQETLRLARHSATAESSRHSVVLQGVSGGGGQRQYSIGSTFLMASIMPQLEAAADLTRFARASLGTGRPFEAFSAEIEGPAYDLLEVPQEIDGVEYFFADRLIARMVMRARDYKKTYRQMVQALCLLGLERRIADVYGTFATGAWLALRDDVPATCEDAMTFLAEEFNAMEELLSFNADMNEEKDHVRIMEMLKSRTVKIESPNYGRRDVYVGHLMEVAAGLPELEGEGEAMISREAAETELRNIGIRPAMYDATGEDFVACAGNAPAEIFLIHRKSSLIGQLLKDTPYEKTAIDVIKQSDGAKTSSKTCRFAPNVGRDRPLIVPIANFRLGDS